MQHLPHLEKPIQAEYPDVLGLITGVGRITMGRLQCAMGVFPQQVYLNQPFELVLLMQSMIDQPMEVSYAVKLPSLDRQLRKVVIETPQTAVVARLNAAEVGIARIPLVVRPPTQAMKRLPLRVQLTLRTARKAQAIRTPDGGPPPAVISLSQFKLQALREVQYNSSEVSEDMIVTYIDIAPKTLPVMPVKLETRYERLWDHRVFDKEQELAQAQVKAARDLAVGAQHGSAYPELLDAVRTRFDQINFPLLPGEDRAIAKMLAYTVDEAPSYEGGHHLSNTMWFPRLCQTLAHSTRVAQMHRSDILTDFLLEAITYDAAMSAFDIVTARWKERLGTPQEQTDHAVRLMRALVGIGEMDLMCIYIPLILGGLAVDRLVNIPQPDDPWELVCDLRQAVSQRFGDDGDPIIIKLIERMLREVEHEVQRYKKNSGWRG